MRKLKSALFILLTGLVVAGAALVPPQLSELRDRGLTSAVHIEALTGDNNFSYWFPEQAERIELVVRWQQDPNDISSVEQSLTESEWSQAEDAVLTELGQLAWDGILPIYPHLDTIQFSDVYRVSLWTEGNLGGAGFLRADLWDSSADWSLSMLLDEESGRAVRLELYWPEITVSDYYNFPATEIGTLFLERLEVEYAPVVGNEYVFFFRISETGDFYLCANSYEHLLLTPLPAEYASEIFGIELEDLPVPRD